MWFANRFPLKQHHLVDRGSTPNSYSRPLLSAEDRLDGCNYITALSTENLKLVAPLWLSPSASQDFHEFGAVLLFLLKSRFLRSLHSPRTVLFHSAHRHTHLHPQTHPIPPSLRSLYSIPPVNIGGIGLLVFLNNPPKTFNQRRLLSLKPPLPPLGTLPTPTTSPPNSFHHHFFNGALASEARRQICRKSTPTLSPANAPLPGH